MRRKSFDFISRCDWNNRFIVIQWMANFWIFFNFLHEIYLIWWTFHGVITSRSMCECLKIYQKSVVNSPRQMQGPNPSPFDYNGWSLPLPPSSLKNENKTSTDCNVNHASKPNMSPFATHSNFEWHTLKAKGAIHRIQVNQSLTPTAEEAESLEIISKSIPPSGNSIAQQCQKSFRM